MCFVCVGGGGEGYKNHYQLPVSFPRFLLVGNTLVNNYYYLAFGLIGRHIMCCTALLNAHTRRHIFIYCLCCVCEPTPSLVESEIAFISLAFLITTDSSKHCSYILQHCTDDDRLYCSVREYISNKTVG